MANKKYYSQSEVDSMIKKSILNNAKEVTNEISKLQANSVKNV